MNDVHLITLRCVAPPFYNFSSFRIYPLKNCEYSISSFYTLILFPHWMLKSDYLPCKLSLIFSTLLFTIRKSPKQYSYLLKCQMLKDDTYNFHIKNKFTSDVIFFKKIDRFIVYFNDTDPQWDLKTKLSSLMCSISW